MKVILVNLVICFTSFVCNSQPINKGVVTYKQVTGGEEHIAKLTFDSQSSAYIVKQVGLDGVVQNSEVVNNGNEMVIKDHQDEFGEICEFDYPKNLLTVREFVFALSFIYQENIPKILWTLTDSTKRIGRFSCQKALTTFRGRNYQAWFTTEIPVKSGPWKLHGLPGLILEVIDNKSEVKFIFLDIKYPVIIEKSFKFPYKSGKRITFETHKTLLTETLENLKNFTLSNSPRGTEISIEINENSFLEKSFEDEK